MQSIAEAVVLIDNSAYDELHNYYVPQVKQTEITAVHSPRYDTGLELLTDLPGRLVQINKRSLLVPRKLLQFPEETVYLTKQVYRTVAGDWKLVCTPYKRPLFGTVAISIQALVLVQTPLTTIHK